jgi:hypothetical protein
MRIYVLHAVSGGEDGGYGVVVRRGRPERVWVPLYRARWVSVSCALFGSGCVLSVGRARAVLVQGFSVRVSYSRWWFLLWVVRWVRFQFSRLL